MTRAEAEELVGGLSYPSKMPGPAFGLPTENCVTGAKLAQKPGSVCSKCYAMRGNYRTYAYVIKPAQQRRLAALDHPQWEDAMVKLLTNVEYFRWFDSGDLQNTRMLHRIARVAVRTPHCEHWLATRERSFVREFLKTSDVPSNLVIRLSASFPDIPVKPMDGVQLANVHKNHPPVGHACPARQQKNVCGDCRACWDKSVAVVSYPEH